ncbi:MAG: hypothetical protein WBD31_13130 [Rubripirellula sp.]
MRSLDRRLQWTLSADEHDSRSSASSASAEHSLPNNERDAIAVIPRLGNASSNSMKNDIMLSGRSSRKRKSRVFTGSTLQANELTMS